MATSEIQSDKEDLTRPPASKGLHKAVEKLPFGHGLKFSEIFDQEAVAVILAGTGRQILREIDRSPMLEDKKFIE
jgi:hypothetical protein